MWSSSALPQAPQVKRCFVIPYSITSVSVLKEQLKDWCCLRIWSFYPSALLFHLSSPWLISIDFLCPNGHCLFALAASHVSFKLLNVWLLFWLVSRFDPLNLKMSSVVAFKLWECSYLHVERFPQQQDTMRSHAAVILTMFTHALTQIRATKFMTQFKMHLSGHADLGHGFLLICTDSKTIGVC